MMGKIIRANDPAEANQPNKVPCGRRPTTVFDRGFEAMNKCEWKSNVIFIS